MKGGITDFATQIFYMDTVVRKEGVVSELIGFVREEFVYRFRATELGFHFGADFLPVFKPALAELAVEKLGPVAERMRARMENPAEVDAVLADGAARAAAIAEPVMDDVRQTVGFWTK